MGAVREAVRGLLGHVGWRRSREGLLVAGLCCSEPGFPALLVPAASQDPATLKFPTSATPCALVALGKPLGG